MFCDSVFAALRDPIVDQLDAGTRNHMPPPPAKRWSARRVSNPRMLRPRPPAAFSCFKSSRSSDVKTIFGLPSSPEELNAALVVALRTIQDKEVQARKEVLARARGLPDRAWRRLLNAPACGSASRPRSRVSQGALWLNGFAAVSGKLVDHICDPPIAGTDKDDGIVAILNEERMGLCLRHFVRDFWRHRV